jgi:hypothetical protein
MIFKKIDGTKEPLFAIAETRRANATIYWDSDGLPACANVDLRQADAKHCSICGNCCITFIINEDATYTCSACGKFPRELLMT